MKHELINPQVCTSTVGYFQILDENNVIKAQHIGMQTQEQLDFVKNHWVSISENDRIVFTEASDYLEPWGFFSPCARGEIVTVYNDLVKKEEHVSGNLSKYKQPHFRVKTLPIEEFDALITESDEWETWVCFVGDEWVGTSEC